MARALRADRSADRQRGTTDELEHTRQCEQARPTAKSRGAPLSDPSEGLGGGRMEAGERYGPVGDLAWGTAQQRNNDMLLGQ